MKTNEDNITMNLTYNIFVFGFPSGSVVKNLPAMQETQEMRVWSLSQEDPPEKGMATHSSILAWEIPCTEEPDGLQSMGSQRVRHDWASEHTTYCQCFTHLAPTHTLCKGKASLEGSKEALCILSNPLTCLMMKGVIWGQSHSSGRTQV